MRWCAVRRISDALSLSGVIVMMGVMRCLRIYVGLAVAFCLAAIGGGVVFGFTRTRVLSFAPTVSPQDIIQISETGASSTAANDPGSFCAAATLFADPSDRAYCAHPSKENAFRLFEVNLTDGKILFWENGLLRQTFPVAYQSPYGKWFETPTGYFSIGVKRPTLKSSIVDVFMEHAVQFYEDFFIHGIPYYPNGTKVTSQFSGGCLRLDDGVAKDFYATAQMGDAVVSYATLAHAVVRPDFFAPVDMEQYWIRQRFNSPLRATWLPGADKRLEYEQHAGVDFAPNSNARDAQVFAIYPGIVERVVRNGDGDAGLGNVVILKHVISGDVVYSLYGHLSQINSTMVPGSAVAGGQTVGMVGNTGYGCAFWHIGGNGCEAPGAPDTHLHLEIKTASTLAAPVTDPACRSITGRAGSCVGYTSDTPTQFGYRDPMMSIFESF
ncbi:MAG: peptidoglycan DD-metalloendopeptidase family protein [Candidatus Paceibacterota bacterium]|jgi:murein DD-endopeptidase MepM/ murein hydrolase activator NlpD